MAEVDAYLNLAPYQLCESIMDLDKLIKLNSVADAICQHRINMEAVANIVNPSMLEAQKTTTAMAVLANTFTARNQVALAGLDKLKTAVAFTSYLPLQKFQVSMSSGVEKMLRGVRSVEPILAREKWEKLQISLEIPQFSASLAQLTEKHGALLKASQTFKLPTSLLDGAMRELNFAHVSLNNIIPYDTDFFPAHPDIDLSEIDYDKKELMDKLQTIHPSLAKTLAGAKELIGSKNPDRARHLLSSLRELLSHVLRILAPDDKVLIWLPSDNKDLLYEGKPTRRAKILFLCHNHDNESLSSFTYSDVAEAVKFMSFCNKLHDIGVRFSDEELESVLNRGVSNLHFLTSISNAVN